MMPSNMRGRGGHVMPPSGAFESYGTEPPNYMGGGQGGGYGYPMQIISPGPGYDMRGGDPYMGGAMQGSMPYGYATQGATPPPLYSGQPGGGYPVMMVPGDGSYGYGGMGPGLVLHGGPEYDAHAHGMGMYGGVPPNHGHVNETLVHGMREHAAENNQARIPAGPAHMMPHGRYRGGASRGRMAYGGFRGGAMQRGQGRGVLLCCHFLIGQCAHGARCRFSHDDKGGACRYGGRCRFGHHRRNQAKETTEPADGCSAESGDAPSADPEVLEAVDGTNFTETA